MEDDWEEFDLEAVEQKQKEELKKKQEEQAELERQEKLKKQKEKEEKEKNKNKINRAPENAAAQGGKKAEGMYLDYVEKKSSYDDAVGLIGGESEFVKPKIDLLQPKTEKEFQDFGRLVADKLREFDVGIFTGLLLTR